MTTRKTDWQIIPVDIQTVNALHATIGGNPLTSRALAQRGIATPEAARAFLNPGDYPPTPPETLPDLESAVRLLAQTIAAQKKILVWGDFDVDGQTATALLVEGLRELGGNATYYVPHRVRESHGIQVATLQTLIRQEQPALLLTCDTGTSAHEAIDYANQQGLTVIVTDHHDLPPDLPSAAALVNPHRLPADHPLASLPGVGVAYKLIQALYSQAGQADGAERLLDLVAIGIVADVATLTGDTRYLLQRGLQCLRKTQRLGLRALFEVAGLQPDLLSTDDIGYQLGPRLNAIGRLDDATQAVELLTTQDPVQARVIAARLDGLNRKRQVMQRQILAAAQEMLVEKPELLDSTALVLYHPAWHVGLLGIVAGQLAERYQRPCVLLAGGPEDGLARGSARSVTGYDIGRAVAAQAELLHAHGGHPGAAGLSLPTEHIDTFRRRLSRTLQEQYQAVSPPPLMLTAEITLDEITPELAIDLQRLAPFGPGNPPVLLSATHLELARHRLLGRERLHRHMVVRATSGAERPVLWWNGAEHTLPEGPFDMAFTLDWDTYQGRRELVLTLQALRTQAPLEVTQASHIHIEDWRTQVDNPSVIEAFLQQEPTGIIWAEGNTPQTLASSRCYRRHELPQAEALLIYTAPPSPAVLHSAIEAANPQRVYLLGTQPSDQSRDGFLRRLMGLCKYTVRHKSGQADLLKMAAATAQTVAAIQWGLRLLAAKNVILLTDQGGSDTVEITAPSTPQQTSPHDEQEAEAVLHSLLAESAAYRTFFRRASTTALLA
ncbi:MAG: single-stranded-DNA-specific exonuclease RecJ [Anaerolineae bacterium]